MKSKIFLVFTLILFLVVFTTNLNASTTISTNINTGGSLTVSSTGIFAGNVGIGTTTPATSLSIVATPSTTSYVDGIATTIYPANLLSITDTTVSAVRNAGSLIDYIANPPSNPGAKRYYGQEVTLSTPSSNEQSMTSASLTGIFLNAYHQGSGSISNVTSLNGTATVSGSGNVVAVNGLSGTATVSGSGNVTSSANGLTGTVTFTGNGTKVTARGVFATLVNTGSGTITNLIGNDLTVVSTGGTITNLYGFRFDPLSSSSGTINNTYGFYVGDITSGTQANTPYSFYASDAGAYNYFAGNTGIGTTTPQTKLHVSSGASATTTVTVGELGLTTSKACVNMNRDDGNPASFFINAAGTIVVELNYCR
ncbi:MAG: hypothetical protein WCW47_00490 [Candidatus Paceibacterota bacterium]|jgi:hypothetical protein